MSRPRNKDGGKTATLAIRIQPRAAKNEVVRMEGGAIKIRLTAPPVEGAANEALVKFLSGAFNRPRADIAIVSGMKSRSKVVRIEGISDEDVEKLLKTKEEKGNIE
ncbi:MAG TPA: YggU family protein [Nitrospiraceae bacterium]|nr:YggU family protein [Nitrospiraceae bacterium]